MHITKTFRAFQLNDKMRVESEGVCGQRWDEGGEEVKFLFYWNRLVCTRNVPMSCHSESITKAHIPTE